MRDEQGHRPPPVARRATWRAAHNVIRLCRLADESAHTGGGGASTSGRLGCAAGTRPALIVNGEDQASGAAVVAAQTDTLSNAAAGELDAADADAKADLALQATWKKDFHGNKSEAQAKALAVPQSLVERCARHVAALDVFYPKCNPNILSDAKVGIHLLAGAARAAFATVLVNDPPPTSARFGDEAGSHRGGRS